MSPANKYTEEELQRLQLAMMKTTMEQDMARSMAQSMARGMAQSEHLRSATEWALDRKKWIEKGYQDGYPVGYRKGCRAGLLLASCAWIVILICALGMQGGMP